MHKPQKALLRIQKKNKINNIIIFSVPIYTLEKYNKIACIHKLITTTTTRATQNFTF